jgi:hypothetical protein
MTGHQASQLKCPPPIVSDLALRLGADPDCAFDTVAFSQTGKMRISLKSRVWLPFTARQAMTVRSCAFVWNARFSPLGYMNVTDAFESGIGRLDVTALGLLPIARSKPNAALTRGELIRYLAELPLLPDAMLHNREIAWREIDSHTIAVTAGVGDTSCEVIFALGADKRVATAFCADRAASAAPPFLPMPWRGEFCNYRQKNGRWIPTEAQVGWVIDGKDDTYWKGVIRDWKSLGVPSA